MNDYPTRAAIDGARDTIEALQNAVDRNWTEWRVTWIWLEAAREILTRLDAFPGLHYPAEPKPEPKPTAAEVLEGAWRQTEDGSVEELILGAALRYAETGPTYFSGWHTFDWPDSALIKAAFEAAQYGDSVAEHLLTAAACVASAHRHLFGGAK